MRSLAPRPGRRPARADAAVGGVAHASRRSGSSRTTPGEAAGRAVAPVGVEVRRLARCSPARQRTGDAGALGSWATTPAAQVERRGPSSDAVAATAADRAPTSARIARRHLVAAAADRGPDRGRDRAVGARARASRSTVAADDAGEQPGRPAWTAADHAGGRVGEQHRHAVGDEDREREAAALVVTSASAAGAGPRPRAVDDVRRRRRAPGP